MPNLRNWIEAQLKRGRTKQQIKGFLARKGYPQAAVAEVDKIAYTSPSARTLPGKKIDKKISSKTIGLISIVIGIVFLIWLFNALPFFSEQASEDVESQIAKEPQQYAKAIIENFLEQNLKNEFVPSGLVIEQRMMPEGKVGSDKLWGYNWEKDNVKFYVSTEYNTNNPKILNNIVEIFIGSENFDEAIANSIVKGYFKEYGKLKCNFTPKTKIQYCESYLAGKGSKIFVGSRSSKNKTIVAFACEIPVGSEIYSWKSCAKPFKDTGV